MIEFRDVSKTYENGTHALNHVNIKINKGDLSFSSARPAPKLQFFPRCVRKCPRMEKL